MTSQNKPLLDLEPERRVDAQCLVLEMSGQTWHVPFDALTALPIRAYRRAVGRLTFVRWNVTYLCSPLSRLSRKNNSL